MSLVDQSQQWYPTSVQVTVLQARNLRIKGKNGTNDAYAVMQVAKEKFATSVAEKTASPMWKEEATFELPLFQRGDAERCTLRVSVLHRALVGPDKLLGQAAVNLLELNSMQSRSKTEWLKLLDKAGKPDKDRGEVLVNIQFLRNNMTASMFDLSAPDKQRSRLGKLKDKVRGKKKEGLSDSASAVVPTFTQVLTDSEGEGEPDGDGAADKQEKQKKHKLKSLFSPKSNLQRNVSQSMSVLGPLPERNSSLTGSRSSGLNIDSSEGKNKFKFLTHKRTGSSDSKGSQGPASILGRSRQASASSADQSNLCINGSHVYTEEPQARSSRASSTFSLASSGRGSMEDLRRSQGRKSSVASVDSLKAGKQPFSWEEESIGDREEQEEEVLELEGGSIRVEQAPERKLLDVEQRAIEDEKKRVREVQEEESIRRIEQERRRLMEEQIKEEMERAEEKERIRREKEIRIKEQERKKVEEDNRRIEEEERIRREERDQRKVMEGAEKIRFEEEEKRAAEERKNTLMEEEVRRARQEDEEEEKVRQQERLFEEERRRKLQEDRVKREEEHRLKVEEDEMKSLEEEDRVRKEVEECRREEEEERKIKEMEERRKREEDEKRKVEERRKEEEDRLKREEEHRLKVEEEERNIKEMEDEKRKIEERRRRKEEEDRLKREEEHRLKVEEEERKRLDLQEKMRKEDELRKEEEERRRLEEEDRLKREEHRLKVEEDERKRLEEEERVRKEVEEHRLKVEEEERKRLDLEEKMRREDELRKEEEERRRLEEEERVRKEVEECRRKEEEERKIKEMEERRKREEDEKRKVEERRKEEEDRLKREEEHRLKVEEEERNIKEMEDEKRKIEERRRRKEEEDRLKREEEHRLKVEEERKREEEEDRVRKEVEECRRKEEEERKIKEMEEKRKREEDEKRKIEERRKEEEDRLKEEDERKIREQQRLEREMEEKREEERENVKRLEEESLKKVERQKLEEESRKVQEEKRRAEDQKMKATEEKERARLEEERRKEADLEKRRREEEEQGRQEQEKMRLTVAEKKMVLQDGGGEALMGKNPFEEDPSEDSFEDFPSTNPFEETSTAQSTEPLNRTTKVSAVKPSSSSCLNPSRMLAPPNPFFSPSELESPTAPPVGHQGIKPSQDSSASQTEKKRQAPLPPDSLSVPRSSNVAAANPTKPTLRSHSAAELGGETDARQSKDGVCLDRCGALQDKRPAPQPPDSLRGKPDTQIRTQEDLRRTKEMQSKTDRPGEEKESFFSRDSLCAVQMIAPLKASTTATREESKGLEGQGFLSHRNQRIDVSAIPSATGGFRVVKKGPAPSKPDSSSLRDKTVTEYDGNTTNVQQLSVENYPSNRSQVVFEINSVAGSGKETQSHETCDEREGLKAPNQTGSINEEVTLRKSSKVSRAPLPPAKMKTVSAVTLETPQNSETPGSGRAVNKHTNNTMMKQPVNIMTQTQCFSDPAILEGSPGKTPEPQPVVSGQGVWPQACEARCSESSSQGGEEVGRKRGQPASASRRPHPVKPLSSSEQQPLSTIQGVQPEKSEPISGGIKEKIKVQEPAVTGPYSQLTQEELISLVVKQQKQLADKDKKIAELELYIDNLLVRVIEEAPCILMSLNSLKR